MNDLTEFVSNHLSDDLTRLILDRGKWPEIDIETAVSCIESRRKLKGKVQEWYENPELIFPIKLSAEQCSSSATGKYKAAFAEHIINETTAGEVKSWRIADLTGGLGVDSWFFSQKAQTVLYNEMKTVLMEAAAYNFNKLGADNITVRNHAVTAGSICREAEGSNDGSEINVKELLSDFAPDIIYLDPARRSEDGKKVFLIEECTPDVLRLQNDLFEISRHILIKLSPMADISMVCNRLGKTCRQVHAVAAGSECKELLIWMDREWAGEYSIVAVELKTDGTACSEFTFSPTQEKDSRGDITSIQERLEPAERLFLFEPGKALMKAGAFNLISERFGIRKLGTSTHYYITDRKEKAAELKNYGKVFRIIRCSPFDKRSIKAAGADFPQAEVTSRNLPLDTDTLRKKLKIKPGGSVHIFGLGSELFGNLLIITDKSDL